MSAAIHAPRVFSVCLCQTLELHPVLIKAECSFYIITGWDACLQHILLLSVCCTHHPAPGTLATLLFPPMSLHPFLIYCITFSFPISPRLFSTPLHMSSLCSINIYLADLL